VNRFIKVFGTIFVVFLIVLILNTMGQMNSPMPGDWATVTTNYLGFAPYVMLIFFGLFYALKGKK
jgi:hypothetical protein